MHSYSCSYVAIHVILWQKVIACMVELIIILMIAIEIHKVVATFHKSVNSICRLLYCSIMTHDSELQDQEEARDGFLSMHGHTNECH